MPDVSPQPDSAAPQQQVHRVPAYAAWFRHDRLHQLEVKGLPEYFQSNSPTKNPRVRLYRWCMLPLDPCTMLAANAKLVQAVSAKRNGCIWLRHGLSPPKKAHLSRQ